MFRSRCRTLGWRSGGHSSPFSSPSPAHPATTPVTYLGAMFGSDSISYCLAAQIPTLSCYNWSWYSSRSTVCVFLANVVDPWHFPMAPAPRIPTTDLRIQIRIQTCCFRQWPSRCQLKIFVCLLVFEGIFTSFFKDKSHRSHKTVEIKVFLTILLDDAGILNVQKQKDLDPQHWFW